MLMIMVQMMTTTMVMVLRCRSGTNNCMVTEEKRNCISCRYTKCINAGMKVLLIFFLIQLMMLMMLPLMITMMLI